MRWVTPRANGEEAMAAYALLVRRAAAGDGMPPAPWGEAGDVIQVGVAVVALCRALSEVDLLLRADRVPEEPGRP